MPRIVIGHVPVANIVGLQPLRWMLDVIDKQSANIERSTRIAINAFNHFDQIYRIFYATLFCSFVGHVIQKE